MLNNLIITILLIIVVVFYAGVLSKGMVTICDGELRYSHICIHTND